MQRNKPNPPVSIRFTDEELEMFSKKTGEKIGITTVIHNCAVRDISITTPCRERGDFFIQPGLLRKFYELIPDNMMNEWLEYEKVGSMSCMRYFTPSLEFEDMSKTLIGWFDFNGENNGCNLKCIDDGGFRYFTCNHNFGYKWSKVKGEVYAWMFEERKLEVKDANYTEDMWELAVKIPK